MERRLAVSFHTASVRWERMVHINLAGRNNSQWKLLDHVLLSVLVLFLLPLKGAINAATSPASTVEQTSTTTTSLAPEGSTAKTEVTNQTVTSTSTAVDTEMTLTSPTTTDSSVTTEVTNQTVTSTSAAADTATTATSLTTTDCNATTAVNYWMRISVNVTGNLSEHNESHITAWLQSLFQQHLGECRCIANATSATSSQMPFFSTTPPSETSNGTHSNSFSTTPDNFSSPTTQSVMSLTAIQLQNWTSGNRLVRPSGSMSSEEKPPNTSTSNSIKENETTTSLFQNIEVVCDNKTAIRHTECTVLLQLSRPTSPCCIARIVSIVQINSTIQGQVIGNQVERVGKELCHSDATEPPVRSFERCNGSLNVEVPCNSNATMHVLCGNSRNTHVTINQDQIKSSSTYDRASAETPSAAGGVVATSSAAGTGTPTSSAAGMGILNSSAQVFSSMNTGTGTTEPSAVDWSTKVSSPTAAASSPIDCMFSLNCSDLSRYYWMRISVNVTGNVSEHESNITEWIRSLFQQHECRSILNAAAATSSQMPFTTSETSSSAYSNSLGTTSYCFSSALSTQNISSATAVQSQNWVSTKSTTNENTTSLFQGLEVMCDNKTDIRRTECTVLLQLSRPTSPCCITCIVSIVQINSTIQGQVVDIRKKEVIAEDLLNQSKNGLALNSTQVQQIVFWLEMLLSKPNVTLCLGNISINIVSNLLDASAEVLRSISNRIIRIVDAVGLQLKVEGKNETILSPSVALAVVTVNGTHFQNTSFTMNSSNLQIDVGTDFSWSINNTAFPLQGSITLPSTLLSNLTINEKQQASRIQFHFYQNSSLFQDPAPNSKLISGVLGCSVANLSISNLTDNVTITLKNTENVSSLASVSCVFWNFSLNNGSGGWSSEGCTVLMNSTMTETVCSCNHLTDIAVLVCPGDGINTDSEALAEDLLNQTKNASALNSALVELIVSRLEPLVFGPRVSQTLGKTSINIVSNLLAASPAALASTANRIVGIVDSVGLKLVVQGQSETILSPSVALAVKNVTGTVFEQTSFTLTDSSTLQIAGDSVSKISTLPPQGSIILPASLMANLTQQQQQLASRVQFNFYQKTTLFQDRALRSDKDRLISGVLGCSVANLSISNLQENVTITLRNNEPVSGHNAPSIVLTYITHIGCGISAIFLSFTLITYLAFQKLRVDIPAKILIQFCWALLLLNLVFLLDSGLAQKLDTVGLCITTAFFLHYFTLASFTWMALHAAYMYLTIVKVFNAYFSNFMVKLGFAGWGIPLVVVITVLAINKDFYGLLSYGKLEDGSKDYFCWFKIDEAFYVAVMAYFCVTYLLSFSMFIVVMVLMCRIRSQNPQYVRKRALMQDIRSITALLVFLGLTWGFAFFAWGPVNLAFMYLFTICNSLQGFFIFVFYCAAKENVRNQWRTYLCCADCRLQGISERMYKVFSRVPFISSSRPKMSFSIPKTLHSETEGSRHNISLHPRSEIAERLTTVAPSSDIVLVGTEA